MCSFQYEVMQHMAYCFCEGDCFTDCSQQNYESQETVPVNKDAVCISSVLCLKRKCVIWHKVHNREKVCTIEHSALLPVKRDTEHGVKVQQRVMLRMAY